LDCAERVTKKYLGRMTEKCEGMEVFRSNLSSVKAILKRENIGFAPMCGVSSTAAAEKQKEREEGE